MLDALSILQEAYECGILDATEVAIKINMTKENYVKERHPYSISSRKDGRFIATVRKEDEERQQIAAPSYVELISKLYDYYNDRKSDYTISDLYEMWVEKRGKQSVEGTIDIKTVKRDEQHWRKYYADNKLVMIPIKKITTKMLNDFLNDSITTFKFSRKEFNNMKTILNAVYLIAMDKEILSVNPLLNTHTDVKFRSIQKKKDGSRLYLEKEMEVLEDFLYQQETMEAYTILMDFQIGTRIGELVVLQKEDMLDGEVYIHKMEIVDEERVDGVYIRKGYKVVEYVKHDISAGYRTIPLSKKAKKILEEVKKLSPDSEYLFTQANGEKMTSRSFNYWLEKYCRDAGITFKSSHCIRRTFARRLYAKGMPLEEISVYMGHEDSNTTKGYIYNYNEIEKNRAYMDKAL
ncbi:tyrosine-type recombinase/integrase [Anaerocolumna sp. MB42-C2]|uniref:tyrosine-type recombinase/integrase n=1 Tax=Anaerocolumna sp. MB42-C2 TaxID=3070997 RepID=UPI0027E127A4|nr:tyrosine-type recombinase/integrase [Anaerocolumna sp. MB42-C2]WMJ87476.1 tyrosine-type recombinase/integrase [Anaerocolumna sp. MB42-C2]